MRANAIHRTLVILSCLISFSAAAQIPQHVNGTTATLTAPQGFTPSTQFAGFADEATQSSILIAELPPQVMKTVSLGAAPSVADKLASLPFTVVPAAPFRVLDVMAGSTVAMTVGDKDVDPKGEQPLLIIAAQLGNAPVLSDDPAVIAKTLLRQTKDLANAAIETETKVAFGGASDAVLLEGKADGDKRFAQYFAAGPSGHYVRLIAFFAANRSAELRPAIDNVAGSIAFK